MYSHFLDFSYKARYFKLGEINQQTQWVWFVCHGYGQLAEYFLKKFKVLDNGRHCIIAPEGLSRFYMNGFQGRVGATWMTKEDRLVDILNYVNFLNSLYESELGEFENPGFKISLLGFSQGTATICRWALAKSITFHRLILWAGLFPPDLNFDLGKTKFTDKEVWLIYGDQDQFLTSERLLSQKEMALKLDVEPQQFVFSGGHEIDENTLKKFL